mmetsp:Transcript_89057/g.272742  ORF Transcript_89057/g.272742 Transcript_89057/m.272742 type:complete len:229 (+) Transcript_89057:121-807(+)
MGVVLQVAHASAATDRCAEQPRQCFRRQRGSRRRRPLARFRAAGAGGRRPGVLHRVAHRRLVALGARRRPQGLLQFLGAYPTPVLARQLVRESRANVGVAAQRVRGSRRFFRWGGPLERQRRRGRGRRSLRRARAHLQPRRGRGAARRVLVQRGQCEGPHVQRGSRRSHRRPGPGGHDRRRHRNARVRRGRAAAVRAAARPVRPRPQRCCGLRRRVRRRQPRQIRKLR